MKGLDDPPRDFRAHRRAAFAHFEDGLAHFLRRRALEQITARARLECVEDFVVIGIDRDHDDEQFRQLGFQLRGRLDPGNAGHVDVHQDDVGLERGHLGQRLLAAFPDPDALAIRRALDDAPQAAREPRVVFDDGDGGHGGVRCALLCFASSSGQAQQNARSTADATFDAALSAEPLEAGGEVADAFAFAGRARGRSRDRCLRWQSQFAHSPAAAAARLRSRRNVSRRC